MVVGERLARAARGPCLEHWDPPPWLLEHQVDAARRVAACLAIAGGALLADAVGLGKTYVALATTTRYRSAAAVVPAALVSQWRRAAARCGVTLALVTHEALSRERRVPAATLVIVDEAHHFRHAHTRRYTRLAAGVVAPHVLLVSATPVVNRGADLVHLLRLFLPDRGLAPLGVSSLERAVSERRYRLIARAAAPLVIARNRSAAPSLHDRLPRLVDGRALRALPLRRPVLVRVVRQIDGLAFPGAGAPRAAELLRLHLFHRLASSAAALVETLERHRSYLHRAATAAQRGERLPRGTMRALFGAADEFQLELDGLFGTTNACRADALTCERERRRVERLIRTVRRAAVHSPKVERLREIVERRGDRPTLVFTTAVATARTLAARLAWRETAVVGAGRAWIASGPVPVDTALALFAPRARGAPDPPRAARVRTLIATDLASEGLDLQDADAVVHFDLPWTPVRLQQRLGRIVRLGSPHAVARTWWFTPPVLLERRLRLLARLRLKGWRQFALGAPETTLPERATVGNPASEARERLVLRVGPAPGDPAPLHAVVRGPPAAAVAVHWQTERGEIPELLVVAGRPPTPVEQYGEVVHLCERLREAPPVPALPPRALVRAVRLVLRRRLAAADGGPANALARRLGRRVLEHARAASRRRDQARLALLDGVLDRLAGGLRIGAERALERALDRGPGPALAAWNGWRQPVPLRVLGVRISAALFGDGSVV